MLLIEANVITDKPINPLMALKISNASFMWDSVGDERKGQWSKKKRKNSLSKRTMLWVTQFSMKREVVNEY